MSLRTTLAFAALLATLGGCASVPSKNLFDAGPQCNRQSPNWYDRDTCVRQTREQLRDYDERRQELQQGDAARKDAAEDKGKALCFHRAGTGERVCPN